MTSTVAKRQTGVNTLTAPTSTSSLTYDYWWPFPSADVSPLTNTATTSSVIPIYISLLSTIPITSGSDASPTEPSSTISPSDASALGTSSSSQSSALPSAALNATKSPFNPIDLVPAFGAVGIFLIGLGIWVLYGCCTRKPRVLKDDGELITGPPYMGLHGTDTRRDVEDRGQDEDMISVRKYGQSNIDAQYRWPSYSEPPIFDPKTRFHVPDQYMHDYDHKDEDEDATLLSVSLVAPGRSRSARALRSSSSALAIPLTGYSYHGHDAVSRQHSSATSAALHELYESDSEEDARRRAKEPPWESLRHKSIKRGILEQVKKESTWMDSVRSSLMGVGTSAGPKRERSKKGDEEEEMHAREETDARVSPDNARSGVGRRRGHVRANSDNHVADSSNATPRNIVQETDRSAKTTMMSERSRHQRRHLPQAVVADVFTRNSNDIITPPPRLARGRHSYAWLKDEESEDRYTPLPARVSSSRSRSPTRGEGYNRSRSRSTSPVKRLLSRPHAPTTMQPIGSNTAHALLPSGGREREEYAASASARALEILPQSPSQIMSPPLESQICFTPIPPLALSPKTASAAKVSAPRPLSRNDSVKPTRIPSPKKKKLAGNPKDDSSSRSRQHSTTRLSDSPPVFPLSINEGTGTLPASSASISTSAARDASRAGRRRQKSSTRGNTERILLAPSGDRILSPRLARRKTPRDETGTESIIQKVDHIIEVGWNERDLESEGMRSLSPTGFGRDA